MQKLRILIMNRKYNATAGGVERMSTLLATELSKLGHECHIVSLDTPDASMYFNLAPEVKWHRIANTAADIKASWQERFKRFFKIRAIMRNYKIDVAIGFQDGAYLSLVTSAIGTRIPVIAAERNSPDRFKYLKNKKMKDFVFNSFRFSKFVTIQCAGYKKLYPDYLQNKIETIPNSIAPAEKTIKFPSNSKIKTLLFAGRLDYQKNAGVLIDAFLLIEGRFPDWRLLLVGNGSERDKLEMKVANYNLGSRVHIECARPDIENAYLESDLFCLPSYWEGFPNTLAEAMAYGLPCVGFSECAGVNELIENGVTGLLANGMDNAESLSEALSTLMLDERKRSLMSDASIESVKKYSPRIIFDQWEKLLIKSVG